MQDGQIEQESGVHQIKQIRQRRTPLGGNQAVKMKSNIPTRDD